MNGRATPKLEFRDGRPSVLRKPTVWREHTALGDFQPFFERWSDDEMANCAICLAHMIDKALATTLAKKDEEFVTQGGIKERMTAARMGYRTDQRERIAALERENAMLKAEIERLRKAGLSGEQKPAQPGKSGISGRGADNNTKM